MGRHKTFAMAEDGIPPNFFLHEAMKTLPKIVKIDLLRTLEINQKLKKTQGVFLQEN